MTEYIFPKKEIMDNLSAYTRGWSVKPDGYDRTIVLGFWNLKLSETVYYDHENSVRLSFTTTFELKPALGVLNSVLFHDDSTMYFSFSGLLDNGVATETKFKFTYHEMDGKFHARLLDWKFNSVEVEPHFIKNLIGVCEKFLLDLRNVYDGV